MLVGVIEYKRESVFDTSAHDVCTSSNGSCTTSCSQVKIIIMTDASVGTLSRHTRVGARTRKGARICVYGRALDEIGIRADPLTPTSSL